MPATISQLRDALRRLADWPATDLPVISAYLDLRPQSAGDNPQVRSGQIVLRDRLRELERGHEPHTPAHDSLVADRERIERYIEDEALPDVHGLALFACHGSNRRWEALHTSVDLDDEVHAGRSPRLSRLARLADENQALVALSDTNTLRLFALRSGSLEEIGLLDDAPDDYSGFGGGGWSQARFQRHIEEHRQAFADVASEAIGEVAAQEDAEVIVLAGDEVAVPLLTEALAKPLAERTRGSLRIDARASLKQVEEQALPFLEAIRTDDNEDAADRLVGAQRSGGLATTGLQRTLEALRIGQVLELVVDVSSDLDEDGLEESIRAAATTDARIRFCDGHEGLHELGGIGGLLRFDLGGPVSDPQAGERREGAPVTG